MAIALETSTNTLILEEFLALPETKPASEYINDQIYQKPMPQGKRSTLEIFGDWQISVQNMFDLLKF